MFCWFYVLWKQIDRLVSNPKNIPKWDYHSSLTGILRESFGLIPFFLAAIVQKQTSMFFTTIYMKFSHGPTK